MKRQISLLAMVSMIAIIVSMFAYVILPVKAQPPLETDKFWEGNIGWGPSRADPARAYDALSGEIIFNVYETLVAPNGEDYANPKPMLATTVPPRTTVAVTDLTSSSFDPASPAGDIFTDGINNYVCIGYSDLDVSGTVTGVDAIWFLKDGTEYRSWQITSLSGSTMSIARYVYVFDIGTGISFYDGAADVGDLSADDVVYSIQRGLVMDQSDSPQWMFYEAFFGTMNSNDWDADSASRMNLAHLIDWAISKTGPNEVTMSLGMNFPNAAWLQTLENTWGSILDKEYSVANQPNWDGNLLTTDFTGDPAWWNSIRHIQRTFYDTINAYKYVGTGPYYVSVFDEGGNKVIFERNTLWWKGWPTSGTINPFGDAYVNTYEIDYIADWATRRDRFLLGAIDTCAVPRDNMLELLDPITKEPILIGGKEEIKTIKNLAPTLSMVANHMVFPIAPTSAYIGTGNFPDGIPTDFFSNTHVRKAFAYSLDTNQYTQEAYSGEAGYRRNMFVLGLVPDYYDAPNGYDIDYAKAETELKAAVFPGGNVWTQGFTLTLTYKTGDKAEEIACELTRNFFNALSTYNGRIGPPFTVNIEDIPWSTYLSLVWNRELPIFHIGWQADFADADNFVRPYMHSDGELASLQGYTAANGWGTTKDLLIDQGLVTPDGPLRQAKYTQLQQKYYEDCPSYPLPIPTKRRWCRAWVKNWYYNAMYDPGTYIPSVHKCNCCWFDVTGTTAGIRDGITNMRDIQYQIMHFNAKAPVPGKPFDPKWVGTYGNGCVDPYGDRICNMRDIQRTILHFNHKHNNNEP